MPPRVLIIHGWGGHPGEGWFPWLKRELEARGFAVTVPQMPDPDMPKLPEWLTTLQAAVGTPDTDTFFVGHSLGCYTIAKYLEGLPEGTRVGGAVFVAGFSGRLNIPELENFYRTPLDWEVIKRRAQRFVAIHSDNDPYVPLERGEEIRDNLGAELIVLPGMKHFSGDEGCCELSAVRDAVLELARQP